MSLKLIQGPPNSGRAGHVRRGLLDALERDPVLVVPTDDDVYAFQRELSGNGAILGASVVNFDGLFAAVVAAGGMASRPSLSSAQRRGAVAAAVEALRGKLGPLGNSSRRPGFADALVRLLDELQGAGLEPADVEAAAGTLEGSAYLADVAALFSTYAEIRDSLGRIDAHGVAREAIRLLREEPATWRSRPVFLYGFDDLTGNQLEVLAALAATSEVVVAVPFEEGNTAFAARRELLDRLEEIGVASRETIPANPQYTDSPLLFHLERCFGVPGADRAAPDDSLRLLRSAGERGEAEAIGGEVAKLLAAGADPEEIAVVVRDPVRRGPLLAAVLESYGIHTALDADVGVAGTAVGGALIALLEAELGGGRASEMLRFLRGPAGVSASRVDWFERAVRRGRIQSASAALALWRERRGDLPEDVTRLREASRDRVSRALAAADVAAAMAARVQAGAAAGGERSPGIELEARAAAAIANALRERAALPNLAPEPGALAPTLAAMTVRAWSGPTTGRVRIGSPDRLRAARFDHVFVASLQDGEFPRREGRVDPFLSERQRRELGLPPRRENDAEERYLFHAALALPRKRLFLSWRDCDENGAAEARSPFLDDVRRLLDPPAPGGDEDQLEAQLTLGRDLARVVHRLADAPSEDELARALAARGTAADPAQELAAAGASPATAERVTARLAAATRAEATTRAPGPLVNPVVLERLAAVPAYGGTTLEGFDVCSYRWFVQHELRPLRLDPDPDPLVQGGLMHEAIYRLYEERPGGDALPRPGSLPAWVERGRALVADIAAERGLDAHPAERAMLRRVEGLLGRFLAEEAERDDRFRPWLLEAGFGEGDEAARGPLQLGEWGLHGAIDRVDRDGDGRALVIDYKLASSVTPLSKLEEEAKLQLQLYMLAVEQLWGAAAVGGVYYPLRGSSQRRPRGVVLEEAAKALASHGVYSTDTVDGERLDAVLGEARERADRIVARMRGGDIRRDPGPRPGLRDHDVCPQFCDLAPICRRDRAPAEPVDEDEE
ncbi:MAG TPA: PD-(D/E)XK nuclease family protein [Solirubrobacterales bacterium]|nr:PD-(D/E)XK nuclease family protein [Solirubrobacterales bacterium]